MAPDLAERAHADGVRFLLALFVDLRGKQCAELVPVESADALEHDGVGFAGYAVGAIGQQPSDPDLMAIPDLASYTPLPSVREGFGARALRPGRGRRAVAVRAARRPRGGAGAAGDLALQAGAEVEYFLVARDADGQLAPADVLDRAAQTCCDARGVTRMYDHLTEVSTAMNALGWADHANDHEDGNGQFEQNFAFADALIRVEPSGELLVGDSDLAVPAPADPDHYSDHADPAGRPAPLRRAGEMR